MDDEDDDLLCIGTPLQDLSEDDIQTRKAPRVEDQVVTDKQGRRRFHGAFTGGFSAGYFNSVGTKEGWTPSTFVSSKGQRSEAKQSRPQDFMDDEDLEAFGIAPQGIQTTADFDGSHPGKRKRVIDSSAPIPGVPVLEELLEPIRETIGERLLRQLGWRPGQGVGPRVSRRDKAAARKERRRLMTDQEAAAVGGRRRGDIVSDSESDTEDENMKDVTFAPLDTPALGPVKPKTDTFGLGYTPLSRAPVLGGHINLFDPAPLSLTEKKKKVLIKGQAFGVGAFEEDDEDIYATEDMSNYDFGDEKDAKEKGKTGKNDQQNLALLGIVKAIDGFKLSSQPLDKPKVYLPPPLPPGFIPQHKPQRRRFEKKASEVRGLDRHTMTSQHRGHLIGEKTQPIVEVRSGVKGQQQQPSESPAKESYKSLDTSEVDKLYEEFKNSDKRLSSDFKPFSSIPEKQKRYELFLKMKERGQKNRFYLAQPKAMTEWEKERELQEFSRAAKLFQPLVSSMATRFVTAATSEVHPTLKDGLNTDIVKTETKTEGEGLLDPLEPGDERKAAARSGMFGKLTHSIEEWHPDNLLCRRFNVPNPFPNSSFVGVRKVRKEKLSLFGSFHSDPEETAGLRTSHNSEEDRLEGQKQQEEEQMEQEGELNDTPEDYGLKVPVDGPPTMDLFKAIFQDSDSDSDSETEKTPETKIDKEQHHSPAGSSSRDQSFQTLEGTSSENNNTAEGVQTTTSTVANTKPGQRRVRVSRFEPLKKDVTGTNETKEPIKPTNQPEDIAVHTFIPRKKDSSVTKSSCFEPVKEDVTGIKKEGDESVKSTNQPEDIATHTFIPRKKDTSAMKSSHFGPLREDISGTNENEKPFKSSNQPEDIAAHPFAPRKKDTSATNSSHFEPIKEDTNGTNKREEPANSSNQPEDVATHTFVQKKKDSSATKSIVPAAHGIFANVDFVALNSYRNQEPTEPEKETAGEVKHKWPEAVRRAGESKTNDEDNDSASSTDSDDVYGPPAPNHLKNRMQMIQSGPPVTPVSTSAGEVTVPRRSAGWVEKEEKSKSSTKKHKHRSRSKSKKEKKKKKDKKSKKHKEKKKKKDRRSSSRRRKSKSDSESSRSESSSSDSD